MEEARRCMNGVCRTIIGDGELRRGWGLRSGGSANLCSTCGTAFEQLIFCDMFHAKETGWRECNSCGKRLHCGCIASKSFVELLDDGGVQCVSCMKNSRLSLIPSGVLYELSTKYPEDKVGSSKVAPGVRLYQTQTSTDVSMDVMGIDKNSTMNIRNNIQPNTQRSSDRFFGHIKSEQVMLSIGDMGNTIFSSVTQAQGSQISKHDENSEYVPDREPFKSLPKACLDISLGTCNTHNAMETSYNSGNVPIAVPVPRTVSEERENHKSNSSLQQVQVQRSRYLLPKPPRMVHIPGPDATKDAILNVRVARPPGEGRGRNQLLPRYWPRITDQELQQISGDSNSTIVPLFEKVLSASDAGRIGRLVLPKACAEAYFPPISQPEGLPLKIQDAKGKDWIFQFRFWPNNNSRMYVLEGVTPCIHSMQLQAGDTVTFSRIDPEGKLVMGYRKATNTVPLQDSQISAMANGSFCNENFLSGVIENLPVVTGYSGYQTPKGSVDLQSSNFPKLSRSFSWSNMDYQGFRSTEGMHLQSSHIPEKRKGRNIGPKSKRLHIDSDDALELKLTWEEVQNLLCPPPSAKPNIVKIDDQEFEEYDEPPVLGKRTIFTAGVSGSHDQWAQCDACSKWRKLPMDVFVPPKWTCADNRWDPKRCSCSVPDEMSPEELQSFLHQNADFRRRKISAIYKPPIPEPDGSSLDALATAASLGDDASPSTSSVATTTKHPRHRPGCTCIVCIQPPSGKGPKHKPSCTCNVCMTVKRRFKTLMLRKKQRQSEREEAETQKKLDCVRKDEKEADNSLRSKMPMDSHDETESECYTLLVDTGKGQIDLNCHPDRDESQQGGSSRASMISLLRDASLPLEMYLKQNGLMSLTCEQPQAEVSSSSHGTPQLPRGEGKANDESIDLTALEPEGVVEEVCGANDEACGGSDHNSK